MKIAGIYGLTGDDYAVWLLAAPAYARAGQVAGLVFVDYAREDQGKSQIFFQKGKYSLLAFSIIPAALPFYLGTVNGITALVLFFGLTVLMLWFFKRMIGGVTGDTLGAMTELTETLILIAGGLAFMNR